MKNKGITLVALVITIIIMLILAGVTLRLTLGDNGLFKMAKNSVKAYEESSEKEEEGLDKIMDELNHLNPEDAGKEVEVPKKEKDKWDLAKVTPTADGKGNTIPVPKGFYYAGGNIDTGFVISSASGDDLSNKAGGNQFVWIPCTAKQYTDAQNDVMEFKWSSNPEYKDNGDDDYTGPAGGGQGTDWSDNYEPEDITSIIGRYGADAKATISEITSNWENKQTEVAEQSIEKYGGFYIARYEAGIPTEAISFYTSGSGDLTYKRDTVSGGERGATNKAGLDLVKDLKPVSKKGVQAWNWITQPNAKIVAENMYKGNGSVGSYLVDNGAWNVICNRFNNILGTSEEKENQGKTINNSTAWGNYYNNKTTDYSKINGLWALWGWVNNAWVVPTTYKNGNVDVKPDGQFTGSTGTGVNRIELATGASDDFKLYNIYDMAGNMWEWTTGHNIKNGTMFVVPRGACFDNAGGDRPVVRANGHDVLTSYSYNAGFRVVLYINYL